MLPLATPDTLRRRRLHDAPAAPLVTCYDAAGARTELSSASFDNAVAKTANLLRDELGLGAGAVVALMLPLHWWQPVWFASCAAVGAVVAVGSDPAQADLAVCAPDEVEAGPGRAGGDRVPAGPVGPAVRRAAAPRRAGPRRGVASARRPVPAHAGRRGPGRRPCCGPATAPCCATATPSPSRHGSPPSAGLDDGGRLLTTADPATADGALAALTASLTVQGSVVLCADPASSGRRRCRGTGHRPEPLSPTV